MGMKEKIRRAAARKNETRESISKKIGMPLQSYANMICRDRMTVHHAEQVADALGCDIVFLDRETGEIF